MDKPVPKYVTHPILTNQSLCRPVNVAYSGGTAFNVPNPIGGTTDDPLYQDLRAQLQSFTYDFDVSSAGTFDVTLYLMAPVYGTGNFIMDIWSEGNLIFDDLDVETEAGGTYQALIKTFSVNVTDGTLDIQFQMVNKAALVSAIAVVQQTVAPNLAKRGSAEDEAAATTPEGFELSQNYPNPFNPETTIRYSIPEAVHVRLVIYNALGQEVSVLVDGFQQAGRQRVIWNGRNRSGQEMPSGVYHYKLITPNRVLARQFTLLR
jgi:hypothetical protein